MREGFAKDRHTYGDGLPLAPNYTDGFKDDDEDGDGDGPIPLTSKPPAVRVRPFVDQGMGPDSESVEVDVSGVLDAINDQQQAAIYHK